MVKALTVHCSFIIIILLLCFPKELKHVAEKLIMISVNEARNSLKLSQPSKDSILSIIT
ncbi:hypothetical protein H8356DRAFT_1347966 [Neocallimastix lanati (nom. inval.)]|nr:hypothetical protein H8356DRAFT_1347966 [Neocallimastix sp. JGI-2020a]